MEKVKVRAEFDRQFQRSLEQGHWIKSYAAFNPDEYFAELSMWYFGTHGDMNMNEPKPEVGRRGFKKYDAEAFALFDNFYNGHLAVAQLSPTPLPDD